MLSDDIGLLVQNPIVEKSFFDFFNTIFETPVKNESFEDQADITREKFVVYFLYTTGDLFSDKYNRAPSEDAIYSLVSLARHHEKTELSEDEFKELYREYTDDFVRRNTIIVN